MKSNGNNYSVKLQDLANLVLVRNHLVLLMGSRSALKEVSTVEYRKLDSIRASMDKELVNGCLELSEYNLKPASEITNESDKTDVKKITAPKITIASGDSEPKQLSLPLEPKKAKPKKQTNDEELTQAQKDKAEIAKRVAEAKEKMKGSFKRAENNNEDD